MEKKNSCDRPNEYRGSIANPKFWDYGFVVVVIYTRIVLEIP